VTLRNKLNRLIALVVAVFLLLLYIPAANHIPDGFHAELLRATQGTAMFVIFVAFVVKFRRAFSRDVPDSARRFYLGLILWSAAASIGGLWRLAWRQMGGGADYAWMLSGGLSSFLIWAEIVGIFFMLSGPAIPGDKLGDMDVTEPEDISWKRLFLAAGLCAVATYLLVVQRIGVEQIKAFLDWLRPS
jgi:hypothetical protein